VLFTLGGSNEWIQALYTFPFILSEALLDVSTGAISLNFAQAQRTLALEASAALFGGSPIFSKKSAKSRLLRVQIWLFFLIGDTRSKFEGTKPQNDTCINRNTSFEPLSMQIGPKLRPIGWPRKRKKGGKSKSQNRYISPPRGGAILQPICTKFGEFVVLADLITPGKFGSKIYIDIH